MPEFLPRYAKPLTDVNEISADVIPASKIGDGNAESVGNSAERIATTHSIEGGVRV